jgi:hypothetical protein
MFADYTGDNVPNKKGGGSKGDLYLVTKFYDHEDLQRLVKIPASVHENLRQNELIDYSAIPVGAPYSMEENGSPWTGADMSTDGSLIALRDYYTIYFYPRSKYMTIADALGQAPCDLTSSTAFGKVEEWYFESVSFTDDKRFFAEAPECSNPKRGMCDVKVSVYELIYDDDATHANSFLLPLSEEDPPTPETPLSQKERAGKVGDNILEDVHVPKDVLQQFVTNRTDAVVTSVVDSGADEDEYWYYDYYWYYYDEYYYDYEYSGEDIVRKK